MSRHLRVEYPGAIYHVTIRGNARQSIFLDDRDRERFLRRLSESVEDYNIRLYLFCLLSNHAHAVLETPDANLSRFMQSVETGYSVYFNLRHGRVGHLVQGRFGAKLVEGNEYLLKLTRYVHLNPVCTGPMKNRPIKEKIQFLRRYPWSSYRSYIGRTRELDFVEYAPVLTQVAGGGSERRRRYRAFVETGMAETDEEFTQSLKASSCSIGSDAFRDWVDGLYEKLVEKSRKPEDVMFRKARKGLPATEILEVMSDHLGVDPEAFRQRRRNSLLRPVAAKMLKKYGGLTNRAVADVLRVSSGASVGLHIQRCNALLSGEKKWRTVVGELEDKLKAIADNVVGARSKKMC